LKDFYLLFPLFYFIFGQGRQDNIMMNIYSCRLTDGKMQRQMNKNLKIREDLLIKSRGFIWSLKIIFYKVNHKMKNLKHEYLPRIKQCV